MDRRWSAGGSEGTLQRQEAHQEANHTEETRLAYQEGAHLEEAHLEEAVEGSRSGGNQEDWEQTLGLEDE